MASSPTISRQIDGTTMETVTDFIFLGSKIIVDVDSCHEIERRLLIDLWKAWLLMLSFIWRPFQVKHLSLPVFNKSTWRHYKSTAEADDWSSPSSEPRDASKYKAKQDKMKAHRTLWRAECFRPLREEKWPSASHPERAPFLHQLWMWRYRWSSARMPIFLHISWTFSAEVSCSYFISATKVVTWVIFHRTLLRVGRRLSSPAPSHLRPLYHRPSAVSPDVSPPSAFQTQPISTAALCDQIPCLSQTTS